MPTSKGFFETTLSQSRILTTIEAGDWPERFFDPLIDHWASERGEQVVVTDRFGSMTWSEFEYENESIDPFGNIRKTDRVSVNQDLFTNYHLLIEICFHLKMR